MSNGNQPESGCPSEREKDHIEDRKDIDRIDYSENLTNNYTLNKIKTQEDSARNIMLINATLLGFFVALAKDNISITSIKSAIKYIFPTYDTNNLIYIVMLIICAPILCWIISLAITRNILKMKNDPEITSEYLKLIAKDGNDLLKRCFWLTFIGILMVCIIFASSFFIFINYTLSGDALSLTDNGDWLRNLGEPEKAISLYDKAIEINPSSSYAWNGKGAALEDLYRQEEAINCYDKSILIANTSESWHNKGQALVELGKYSESLEACEISIILEKDPRKIAQDLSSKGIVLTDLNRLDEAIQYFNRSINMSIDLKDDVTLATALNNKGNTLSKLGRYNESIEAYNRAIELYNSRGIKAANAWNNKARIFNKQGKYNDSKSATDKTIALIPDYANRIIKSSQFCLEHGRYDDAILYADDAIRINPYNATFWNYKGVAYFRKREYNVSIQNYDRALELDPQNAIFWNNKGIALKESGRRTNEANEAFAKAKELGYKG